MSKEFANYLKDKIELYFIVTYTIGDDDLRMKLEDILADYGLVKEDDQSTYSGALRTLNFKELVEEILRDIIAANEFDDANDFVSIYSSATKIEKIVF